MFLIYKVHGLQTPTEKVRAGYSGCLIKMSCLERSCCLIKMSCLKRLWSLTSTISTVILCNTQSAKLMTSWVTLSVDTIRSVLFSSISSDKKGFGVEQQQTHNDFLAWGAIIRTLMIVFKLCHFNWKMMSGMIWK